MAVINFNTSLLVHPNFTKLEADVGRETAIGMMIKAYAIAREYWLNNNQDIPITVFHEANLSKLNDCGLSKYDAESATHRIYNVEEVFRWEVDYRRKKASVINQTTTYVDSSKMSQQSLF